MPAKGPRHQQRVKAAQDAPRSALDVRQVPVPEDQELPSRPLERDKAVIANLEAEVLLMPPHSYKAPQY